MVSFGALVPRYTRLMGRMFRTLLVWLLVWAVPAHAAVAAATVFCGPSHDRPASAAVAAHAFEDAHERADQGHDAQDSAFAANGQPDADESAPAEPSQLAKVVHADKHKCGACASCCSAAAVHSTVLGVPVPALAPMMFVAAVPAIEHFSVTGPERPPRLLRA